MFQCSNTHSDILVKFLVRVFRIPCFHPDFTRRLTAFPTGFISHFVYGTLINGARLSLRRMEYFSGTCIASSAHFSVTVTCAAVCSADADIRFFVFAHGRFLPFPYYGANRTPDPCRVRQRIKVRFAKRFAQAISLLCRNITKYYQKRRRVYWIFPTYFFISMI